MTISQLKGMIRFHKRAYKAFLASGQLNNARQARERMISTYLQLRDARKAI